MCEGVKLAFKWIVRPVYTGHPKYRQSPECGGRTSSVRRDTRPTWVLGSRTPLAQGRLRSRVGSFPEARPVLGEGTETLCAAGTQDLRWGGCGCFPRASHTPGESPFVDRGAVVGAFPGETYPGRECLLGRTYVCIRLVLYIRGLSANF